MTTVETSVYKTAGELCMYSCLLLVKTSSRALCASTVLYSKYRQKYLGSTFQSTEEVLVSTEKVQTIFFLRVPYVLVIDSFNADV